MGCWGLLGWLLIVSQWIIPENSLQSTSKWVSWGIYLTDIDWRYIYIYMMHRWLYIRDLLEVPRFDSTSGAWLLCQQAVERSTNSKTQSGAARLQGHRHASTICTDALWLNHHPVCGGEHVQFLGLLFSRYSHDIPIIFPWYSHDIRMIFLWYSHDIPMIFQWIFPWYSHDILMIFQWHSHDIPMIFLWYSHDIPMIFLWYSYTIPFPNSVG